MSRRTVFRDLDALRQSGVPLRFDEEHKRYHIPKTYYLPPANFTPEEALALIVLCHDMGSQARLPFFEPARSAAMKLGSTLPEKLLRQLRATAEAVTIQRSPTNPLGEHRSIYEQLLEATTEKRAVRIQYHGPIDGLIATKLFPYRLLFSRRSWYVIGRSSLHNSVRTFNLGRIRKLESLDEPYDIPRGFTVERFLANAWCLIREPGSDHEVVIRFSKLVAQNVAEVTWHKTQRVAINEDGTLDFRVTVSGLREISWWIMGYGAEAEVLKPQALRDIIAQTVSKMVALYGEEPV